MVASELPPPQDPHYTRGGRTFQIAPDSADAGPAWPQGKLFVGLLESPGGFSTCSGISSSSGILLNLRPASPGKPPDRSPGGGGRSR